MVSWDNGEIVINIPPSMWSLKKTSLKTELISVEYWDGFQFQIRI